MKELAVAIQNADEKVNIVETINSINNAGFKKDKNAGMWDISVTGDISTGQDELFAASREIK